MDIGLKRSLHQFSGFIPMYELGLRNRRGGQVTVTGISTILTNPFYIGIMRIKKTGQDFSGMHAPLVSRELFDRVQTLLHTKAVDRIARNSFLFSRLVRCASCQYSLIGERQKGKTYYRCHNRPFKSPPVCPITSIREEQLESAVENVLAPLTLSKTETDYLRGWIADQRLHAGVQREAEMRATALQLEALRARMNRLTDLLLDGTVEKPTFDEKQKQMVWEEAKIRQRAAAIEAGTDNPFNEIERIVELAKDAALLYRKANVARKRELLRILLSNLTVSAQEVDVELAIPFCYIANRAKTSYGAPYRGTCRTLGKLIDQFHNYAVTASWDARS
jgi:site-specific DNA recombinase